MSREMFLLNDEHHFVAKASFKFSVVGSVVSPKTATNCAQITHKTQRQPHVKVSKAVL